jgi:hypothetical protein
MMMGEFTAEFGDVAGGSAGLAYLVEHSPQVPADVGCSPGAVIYVCGDPEQRRVSIATCRFVTKARGWAVAAVWTEPLSAPVALRRACLSKAVLDMSRVHPRVLVMSQSTYAQLGSADVAWLAELSGFGDELEVVADARDGAAS